MSQPKPLRAAKGKSWGTSSPKKTESESPEDSKKRLSFLKQNDGISTSASLDIFCSIRETKKLKRMKKAFEETEETMPFIALRFRV